MNIFFGHLLTFLWLFCLFLTNAVELEEESDLSGYKKSSEVSSERSSKEKRDKFGELVSWNQDDTKDAQISINSARERVLPNAKEMKCVIWNEKLAKKARAKAISCDTSLQTDSEIFSYDVNRPKFGNVVDKWNSENYDLFSDACLDVGPKPCLNYKVLYNEKSEKFGCAIAKCVKHSNLPADGYMYLTVCEFNTALGNKKPYVPGTTCSCSSGYKCEQHTCCKTKWNITNPVVTTTAAPSNNYISLNQEEVYEIQTAVNKARIRVLPVAKHMTCAIWDESLLSKAREKALTCKLAEQTDSEAISFDVNRIKLKKIVRKWKHEEYDLLNDICLENGEKPCLNYKVLFNEKSETFACAIAQCNKQNDLPSSGYLTVCKFNTAVGKNKPYIPGFPHCSGCSFGYTCDHHLCCRTSLNITSPLVPSSTIAPPMNQSIK